MLEIVWVGFGGFVGAVGRYAVGTGLGRILSGSLLPAGTLAVNVLGCFLIGLLAGAGSATHTVRHFVVVGCLGGFTTFSAFGAESFDLLRDGRTGLAAANVLLNVALGLLAVACGYALLRPS